MMKIEDRQYGLLDFVRVPFSIAPGLATLRVVDKVIYALIPSLQILATAAFVDTAINILNGTADQTQIMLPLLWIILLFVHQYAVFAVMGLVRAKMDMKLTECFRTAIVDKRAKLDYRHVENDEVWDLISRVGNEPDKKLNEGFDILLRIGDMAVRVGAILLILVAQVWWAALVITAFSVPLFVLAVRSGRTTYDAAREAQKHTRRAQYLESVLTGREQVEERSLFAYTDELNRRWFERFLAAYKINYKA